MLLVSLLTTTTTSQGVQTQEKTIFPEFTPTFAALQCQIEPSAKSDVASEPFAASES